MKIYQKFILAFSLMTAIVLVLGAVALQTFHQMNEEVTALTEDVVPGAISMLETKAALATLNNEVAEFVITGDSKHRSDVMDSVSKIQAKAEKHTVHEIHMGDEEHKEAQDMEDRAIDIIGLAKQVIQLKETGGADKKMNALQRQMHLKGEALSAILVEHVEIHRDELKTAHDQIRHAYENGIFYVWIAIISAFLLSIVVGLKMSLAISNPIKYAAEIAMNVAKGDFSKSIEEKYQNRRDEIGHLFQALEKMIHDLKTLVTTLAKQKDEALRINQALDHVTTSVLIADTDNKVIYANESAQQFFQQTEALIRQEMPHFQAKNVLGMSVDRFHQQAAAYRGDIDQDSTKTSHTLVTLSGLKLDISMTQVINAEGQHLGSVTEFRDRTVEIATELEVNAVMSAASQGDFNQRVNLADKTGFFKTFSEVLNQTFDYIEQMIEELRQVFAAIANGDLSQTITKDYAGSLEQLKNDVNATINKLTGVMSDIQDAAQAASEGDFTHGINLTDKEGFFATLSEFLNNILESNQQIIGELKHVFAAMANGDLTQIMTSQYVGTLEQLKNDVNATMTTLTRMINTVKQTADVVNMAATEISQGNTNLSQRTEQQAASLEETAASMEEMTGTVQQNSENAQAANQLAVSARDHAGQGGEVVGSAITAMTEISKSSKKVADIIGVIDEIAFQTNLLALNAAVEAARAGDQGRGFAVVAQEVRYLAQRSANAAKEIKGLIQDSVSKVEEGTHLVNQSGATLKEIVVAVKKVSDIISEIAAASREQTAGIQQVNKVVAQLDEMTQQNAALVEEASTASATMKEQVQMLKEHVAFFNTGKGTIPSAVNSKNAAASTPWFKEPANNFATSTPKPMVSSDDNDGWEDF
ncbi:MAG: chemotaxis protein [Candidatus Parabeggiatoa sp. nov. 1]|nr:MAG: chemotaxis protein [Gammaproteobacteria bacterium]